jgi:hypothetical protein
MTVPGPTNAGNSEEADTFHERNRKGKCIATAQFTCWPHPMPKCCKDVYAQNDNVQQNKRPAATSCAEASVEESRLWTLFCTSPYLHYEGLVAGPS